MTEQEVTAEINKLLREAEEKLDEACKLATEHGIPFSWGGPEYGMGGYFIPEGYDDGSEQGWFPSSHSC